MKKPKPTRAGMGKADALLFVFVGLKLGGQLDWSWWWVLSPGWIGSILGITVSLRRLLAPSQDLWKKIYIPGKRNASWHVRSSDGLFFLFSILKWTGHLSWSWFWVLSPLWLLKPLGFLCNSWHEELRRKNDRCEQRLYVYIGEDLANRTGSLVLTALVVLRLDDHITSWWWVVAVFLFYFIASVVFSSWWDTAWSRRLRRAKAERQERCNRELGGGTSDTGGA